MTIKPLVFFIAGTGLLLGAQEQAGDITTAQLQKELSQLQQEFQTLQQNYAARIQTLEAKLNRQAAAKAIKDADHDHADHDHADHDHAGHEPGDADAVEPASEHSHSPFIAHLHEHGHLASNLGLKASVVIDGSYYHDGFDEDPGDIKSLISGFGHHHGDGEHDHHGIENGFNLRHVELGLMAEIDEYLHGRVIVAVDEDGAEIEEAVLQTHALPGGLTLSAGKFPSGIGIINAQHSHDWDFYDQPLVNELMFGHHGLRETGVQLLWKVPCPMDITIGAEAFQGDNETLFQPIEDDVLSPRSGPRLYTGFIKVGYNLSENQRLQLGLSCATGDHQESHDGDENGENDHWLDGRSTVLGTDLLYHYAAGNEGGSGDFTVQGEYFYRRKDLDLVRHDLAPALTGNSKTEYQDGYYIQALYGIAKDWRAGLRWEQVGLCNKAAMPDLSSEFYGASNRASAMIDWRISPASLLRLQASHCDFDTSDGDEKTWAFAFQLQVMFGEHSHSH